MTSTFYIADAARAAYAAGLSVVPPREDGTKQPDGTWKQYQTTRPTVEQMRDWYVTGNRAGVGAICGAVSGNLECFEFDDLATYRAFLDAAQSSGLGDLIERIASGYEEATPGIGVHWLYRCAEIAGNMKLANRPNLDTLIETRGEGGYVILAPTDGRVHPSGGAYRLQRGDVATIATITPDERRELHRLARTFDEMPAREYQPPADRQPRDSDELQPGDDFNQHADWRNDVLEPAGWAFVYQRGDVSYWRRPGKDRGVSATTNYAGADFFICFSTRTPFEPEAGYAKWRVYAILNHGGDFTEAARDLAAQGYGTAEPQMTFTNGTPAAGGAAPLPQSQPWPAPIERAAYHGLAGDIVDAIEPETEADPAALLLTLLAAVGCIVGSGPHWRVSGRPHQARVWPVLVGETSKGRKGTAWGAIRPVLASAALDWLAGCTASGLSSGEGVIWRVRDEIRKTEPVKEKGRIIDYQEVVVDPGITDKRLFLTEEEFAGTIKVMAREGNSLSAVLRQAWDDGDLRILTKNSPAVATGAHVTIVGHATRDELLRYLSSTEAGNGFANRFVWICVRRSKELPDGGNLHHDTIEHLGDQLRQVIETADRIGLIERDDDARELWRAEYGPLSDGGVGLLGAVTSRAEAQVMRLASIYAVLDETNVITPAHLHAALAIWRYAEDSARFIFGDMLGDPVADAIMSALRQSGELTRTDIRDLFGRHQSSGRIDRALGLLLSAGKVRRESRTTAGRPVEVWIVE